MVCPSSRTAPVETGGTVVAGDLVRPLSLSTAILDASPDRDRMSYGEPGDVRNQRGKAPPLPCSLQSTYGLA